jgi:hypothetical protein
MWGGINPVLFGFKAFIIHLISKMLKLGNAKIIVLSVVLCMVPCLIEEHELQVSENSAQENICVQKDEVSEQFIIHIT